MAGSGLGSTAGTGSRPSSSRAQDAMEPCMLRLVVALGLGTVLLIISITAILLGIAEPI
jgi:hypothetical protein